MLLGPEGTVACDNLRDDLLVVDRDSVTCEPLETQ